MSTPTPENVLVGGISGHERVGDGTVCLPGCELNSFMTLCGWVDAPMTLTTKPVTCEPCLEALRDAVRVGRERGLA